MKELKHDLLTSKFTKVFYEEDFKFNAPNQFTVHSMEAVPDGKPQPFLETIHFQEGPIKECGINGVCNEDVIAMVITRLEHFQQSEFSCRENALAITKLEEALLWLRKRTMGREQRNIEGTHEV